MSVARSSPDGRYLASSSGPENRLVVSSIDPESLALTEVSEKSDGRLHARPINDIAWSPCSRNIATAGEDGIIVVWKIHEHFRTDGKLVLEARRVLRGHEAPVTCVAFNKKGTMLASGSMDERAIVWSVKAGVLFKLFNAHSQPLSAIDFSYDSQLVLTASYDGYVRIWSLVDGLAMRIINASGWVIPVLGACFSPNAAYVFIRYTDGQTRMVNVIDQTVTRRYGDTRPTKLVETAKMLPCELAFVRPDYLLVSTDRGVDVYNIQSQEKVTQLLRDDPIVFLDVNETQKFGLGAGPRGVKLFRLDLPDSMST